MVFYIPCVSGVDIFHILGRIKVRKELVDLTDIHKLNVGMNNCFSPQTTTKARGTY